MGIIRDLGEKEEQRKLIITQVVLNSVSCIRILAIEAKRVVASANIFKESILFKKECHH